MPSLKIFAGPILRRVEKRQVSVWLAFSESCHVTLKIWEGDSIKHDKGVGHQPPNELATGEAASLQIGYQLYVALVTADLSAPGLDPTKIYSYNILLRTSDSPENDCDLRSLKMLEDATATNDTRPQLALGYAKDILPTFILPSDFPEKVIVVHGSCRKMHGTGEDALAYLDDVIKDNLKPDVDPDKPFLRPQQLYLTGDQIYADDVPAAFLRTAPVINALSLVGLETVQIRAGNNDPIRTVDTGVTNFPPLFRQHVLTRYAGFTSGAASSHLISFGEFCGAYLHYWNVRGWHEDLYAKIRDLKENPGHLDDIVTGFLDSTDADDETTILQLLADAEHLRETDDFIFPENLPKETFAAGASGDNLTRRDKWLGESRKTLRGELRNMVRFYEALPKVSRALANIPTYMIFDDHEITDDWYITKRWRNQALSKPLGRDVIRNGLMAYAIFQDWGNVPNEYKDPGSGAPVTPRQRLKELINEYGYRAAQALPAPLGSDLDDPAALRSEVIEPIETLLGMGNTASDVKWHYDVPCGQAKTYVLDTRTRREYATLNAAPGLLPDAAIREQLPDSLPAEPPYCLVISPVPALGLSSFEELIQPAAAAVVGIGDGGIVHGALEFDLEAWGFNTAAYERLLDRLNNLKKVVLLSGDVHYGFSSVLDYWKGASATPTARMVQLTASALKNAWVANLFIFYSGMVQRILTNFDARLEKVGWKDKVLTTNGYVSARNRTRLRRATAVVPVAGWNSGSTVSQSPDFRWRLRFASDESAEPKPFTMDETNATPPVITDINLGDLNATIAGYRKIVSRHQAAFKTGIARRVVWPTHLSIISFSKTGDVLSVHHEFLYRNADNEELKRHTKHVIPLTAPGGEQTAPTLP